MNFIDSFISITLNTQNVSWFLTTSALIVVINNAHNILNFFNINKTIVDWVDWTLGVTPIEVQLSKIKNVIIKQAGDIHTLSQTTCSSLHELKIQTIGLNEKVNRIATESHNIIRQLENNNNANINSLAQQINTAISQMQTNLSLLEHRISDANMRLNQMSETARHYSNGDPLSFVGNIEDVLINSPSLVNSTVVGPVIDTVSNNLELSLGTAAAVGAGILMESVSSVNMDSINQILDLPLESLAQHREFVGRDETDVINSVEETVDTLISVGSDSSQTVVSRWVYQNPLTTGSLLTVVGLGIRMMNPFVIGGISVSLLTGGRITTRSSVNVINDIHKFFCT